MHMLISAHRDGRIIADAVTYFGVQSIPGSTRRGGSAALRRMLKQLEAGECVGITPDGPRGPATVASVGIVNLARLAGAPIVPVVFATSRRKILNSWDRFNLALPFGRGVFVWGEPIEIASDLDAAGLEEARLLVETRMNEMAREADRRVGHTRGVQSADQFAPGARRTSRPRRDPWHRSRPAPDCSSLAAEERIARPGRGSVLEPGTLAFGVSRRDRRRDTAGAVLSARAQPGAARKTASGLPNATGLPASPGRAGR